MGGAWPYGIAPPVKVNNGLASDNLRPEMARPIAIRLQANETQNSHIHPDHVDEIVWNGS